MKFLAVIATICLFAAEAISGDFRIAVFGDPQFHTDCSLADTAVDHMDDAIDWVVAVADSFDVLVMPGDLTMLSGAGYTDCECLSCDEADCGDCSTPYAPGNCAAACQDAEAIACRYEGADHLTALGDCEWDRLLNSITKLEAAGIPVVYIGGNHDYDIYTGGATVWDSYNEQLGVRTRANFKEYGLFADSIEGGISSYHIVEAGGVDWLFIAGQWIISDSDAQDEIVAWAQGIIEGHPGMPTIVVSHHIVNGTGWVTTQPQAKLDTELGKYPQVFLNISGHMSGWGDISEDNHIKTHETSGELVVGALHDYSYDLALNSGLPAWVLKVNGGGGVIGIMDIDIRTGWITKRSYSPTEGEFVVLTSDTGNYTQGINWRQVVPMCDESRFSLPSPGPCVPLRNTGRWWRLGRKW